MKPASPPLDTRFRSRAGPPSFRSLSRGGRPDGADEAVEALELAWQRGEPPELEAHWARFGPGSGTDPAGALSVLAALVKADLRCRFARGERPAVADYFERFPQLREGDDRVVSLVYEEYCLREEQGEWLDPDRFCDRYEPWRDSLASQLRYHRLLSQVVSPGAPAPRFPEPGEVFQGFRLGSVLGRGGVARVYLAREPELGDREVALKISPDQGKEPSIQGRLDHAHIVPVLSVTPRDPQTGLRGLCMPYRPGIALDEAVRWLDPASRPRKARVVWDALASQNRALWQAGPAGPGWQGFPHKGTYAEGVAWVVLTLARALEHAHARGILHRDVKPANVLLTFRDGPQLLDFNLAHDPHAAERAEAALRGGTLPYMAPEQLEAFLDPSWWDRVGAQADLYALGLLLAELLTGRRPEPPDPALPLPRAIRELLDRRAQAPPGLRAANPAIPHALESIAARCLASEPARRYPDAAALAEDLQRFLDRRPLRHAPNRSRAELARNWTRRHRVPIALAAALLGAIPAVRLALPEPSPAPTYVVVGNDKAGKGDWDGAWKQYQEARRLDPNLHTAYQGLATVTDHFKQYQATHQYLSRAIALAERATPELGKVRLAELYQMRASASMNWGNALQLPMTPEAFVAASLRYHDALKNLDQARRILAGIGLHPAQSSKDPPVHKVRFNIEYVSAWAELGLGDAASAFDRYEESVPRYRRALKDLAEAMDLVPDYDESARNLARKLREIIEQHLAVDQPRLETMGPDPARSQDVPALPGASRTPLARGDAPAR